jgi:hypothetical protein
MALGKIKVTFKDPDALHNCVMEHVEQQLVKNTDFTESEREVLQEARTETIMKRLSKWFTWSEYLTVEIDLDADTATVLLSD